MITMKLEGSYCECVKEGSGFTAELMKDYFMNPLNSIFGTKFFGVILTILIALGLSVIAFNTWS